MSENKFIKRLKGEQTTKSVLEIKNESAKTSFANMPQGTSNAINVYSDHRGNATAVLEGTDIWKLNTSQFVVVPNAFGDGRDFTSTYTVFGSSLWVNATYTFDQPKIFTGATQWTLKLCGHSLLSSLSSTIGFSLIIKFGNAVTITKSFSVSESAFEFCKEFIVDFSESEQTAIKVANGDTMTVQLLCADATASATIYNGMTTLVAQQRRVDSEAVASDLHTFEDLEVEVAQLREDLDDLEEYVDDTFVRLDGESIMTGPLKMRATSSFQCAIAPYWDGVGFYKLNSDNSVTLIASIETPDGFIPWVTNTYNIGSSVKKWKNLYLSGKAFVATINNGGDLAIPANTTGTLATKADVDLAANSGRMITDQGVWYAKMYGATVAPSAENGTNYADFSQVDGQGNPIIVIYERQNGAWVQSETITPPAEYDGYVPITSKIWDITEQAGQQGGRILWNHQSKEFTPYPQIVSFEDIEVTGTSTVIMPQNPSVNQIVNKDYVDNALSGKADSATTLAGYGITDGANTDLSNLTATGANIANWSSNVTNCITEIPQDIKLELNNGTLTLKAGSKVYVPNGAGVFDEVTIASDIITTYTYGAFTLGVYYNSVNSRLEFYDKTAEISGTTPPSGNGTFYNTTANKISRYIGGVIVLDNLSFPIATITTNTSQITSIDQVFNGFGYIGSTIFALPGVKGLVPDGRNADGSLKNIETEITNVQITSGGSSDQKNIYADVRPEETLGLNGEFKYDEKNNITYNGVDIEPQFVIAKFDNSGGKITNFAPKTAFHAVDYSEADFVVSFQRPTAENNYTWYRKYKSGWVEQGGRNIGTLSGNIFSQTLPVPMANVKYNVSLSPILDSSDTGNYYCRAIYPTTTQIMYYVYYNGGVTTNNPIVLWTVCGMAA